MSIVKYRESHYVTVLYGMEVDSNNKWPRVACLSIRAAADNSLPRTPTLLKFRK